MGNNSAVTYEGHSKIIPKYDKKIRESLVGQEKKMKKHKIQKVLMSNDQSRLHVLKGRSWFI